MSTGGPLVRSAPTQHTLMCSEVWASHRNIAHSIALPGLQGWIYSAPLELGHDGGDIHYLSACDAGVLSRLVLADVSGHGRAVAAVAERTLQLMRTHMNRLDQPTLLKELSSSLWRARTGGASTYATAVVIGFDSSADRLLVTNAGHLPPFWYRTAERRWAKIPPPSDMQVGLPIGLGLDGDYADVDVVFEPGDLLLCYTDGLSDSTNDRGLSLGADGLLDLVRGIPAASPMAVGATLLGLVDAFRRGAPATDDETLIVLQRSA
jgi:serine phosphatase RsbU (regulator of sigma subunit)